MAELPEASIHEMNEALAQGKLAIAQAKEHYLSLEEDDPTKPMIFSQVQLMDAMSELLAEVIRLRKVIDENNI